MLALGMGQDARAQGGPVGSPEKREDRSRCRRVQASVRTGTSACASLRLPGLQPLGALHLRHLLCSLSPRQLHASSWIPYFSDWPTTHVQRLGTWALPLDEGERVGEGLGTLAVVNDGCTRVYLSLMFRQGEVCPFLAL